MASLDCANRNSVSGTNRKVVCWALRQLTFSPVGGTWIACLLPGCCCGGLQAGALGCDALPRARLYNPRRPRFLSSGLTLRQEDTLRSSTRTGRRCFLFRDFSSSCRVCSQGLEGQWLARGPGMCGPQKGEFFNVSVH